MSNTTLVGGNHRNSIIKAPRNLETSKGRELAEIETSNGKPGREMSGEAGKDQPGRGKAAWPC